MQVRLLCVGDVVGAPGRRALREAMEVLVPRHRIDCVIVNAENAAGGSGLTAALYQKITNYGVHLITLGDHVYRRRDIIPILETSDNIVRPANLPAVAPGKSFAICETSSGHRVAVMTVLGRLFMKTPSDCPFAAVDRVLALLPNDIKIVVVEIHAEVTSEKVAMGWHLNGRVSVVFGTHTHIPTADERVLSEAARRLLEHLGRRGAAGRSVRARAAPDFGGRGRGAAGVNQPDRVQQSSAAGRRRVARSAGQLFRPRGRVDL